ncbi:hypothetical protein D3C79_576740 [compost metagenome]
MPTARMMTRIGMPRREESELTRILAPTSNAPIKNRLLMVDASKGSTPGKSGKGGAEHAGYVPTDSNPRLARAVKCYHIERLGMG